MRKIIADFESRGIPLNKLRALEMFAREGDWQTTAYADHVAAVEAWEIDEQFIPVLKKNLPHATVKQVDSIQEMKNPEYRRAFDFIVVDNGQGCYGPDAKYCEHFDVIPDVAKLLTDKGYIIFNINKEPFNFDQFPVWQQRRAAYYKLDDTSKLTLDWLLAFYQKLFQQAGYITEFSYSVSRGDYEHNDYLHYLVFALRRENRES